MIFRNGALGSSSPAWLARFALVGAASLFAADHAGAIEIKTESAPTDKKIILVLSGKFEPGDGLKLRAYVAKLPAELPIAVHFNVGGGSLKEAMSIGRFLHQLGVNTVVPAKAKCVSPCLLAFFGGVDQGSQSRWVKHTSASFGFRSFLPVAKERDYTWRDLDAAVANTQQSILRTLDYLDEVGADLDLLGRIYDDIGANETKYMTDDDLLLIGVSIYDDNSNQLIDGTAIRKRRQR